MPTQPIHPCSLDQASLLEQCHLQFSRRGGPGGQHRNKTETAAVITHTSSGISGEASERRSQAQNRSVAIRRLRVQLALNWRTLTTQSSPEAKSLTPSALENQADCSNDSRFQLWHERILSQRQMISPEHWDYPTVLSLAIDILVIFNFELATSARTLELSTSQFCKLLRQDALVMQWVNQQRLKVGLGRIR